MSLLRSNSQFWASTRGKIVTLLRRASRTVEELAQELDLTDNAVRAQLATLEREGYVRQHGRRRSSSKPAFVYELTPDAEELFSKAYSPVLRQLLQELNEHMSTEEVEAFLRSAGRHLAGQWPVPRVDLEARLEAAVSILGALGGLAEVERQNEFSLIRGYSCPLAAAVPGHPEVCRLTEALITELLGVPVREQCNRNEKVECCFIVPAN